MLNKPEMKIVATANGRVLGQLLSVEEVRNVSGGAAPCDPTDTWVDKGVCTPKSDPGNVESIEN